MKKQLPLLWKTGEDGLAPRKQYELVWKQKIKNNPDLDPVDLKPPELLTPDIPWYLVDVWKVFFDLHRTREVGFTLRAITWEEMQAYSQMTLTELTPWMCWAVVELDDILMDFVATKNAEKRRIDKAKAARKNMSNRSRPGGRRRLR